MLEFEYQGEKRLGLGINVTLISLINGNLVIGVVGFGMMKRSVIY
jgi:hypothetical protein